MKMKVFVLMQNFKLKQVASHLKEIISICVSTGVSKIRSARIFNIKYVTNMLQIFLCDSP